MSSVIFSVIEPVSPTSESGHLGGLPRIRNNLRATPRYTATALPPIRSVSKKEAATDVTAVTELKAATDVTAATELKAATDVTAVTELKAATELKLAEKKKAPKKKAPKKKAAKKKAAKEKKAAKKKAIKIPATSSRAVPPVAAGGPAATPTESEGRRPSRFFGCFRCFG
jgi:adenylate kinase